MFLYFYQMVCYGGQNLHSAGLPHLRLHHQGVVPPLRGLCRINAF